MNIFTKTNNKLGDLKSSKLVNWETKSSSGTDDFAKYVLFYENQYEKFKSSENITLELEDDNKIRIIGYNISSDGFLE